MNPVLKKLFVEVFGTDNVLSMDYAQIPEHADRSYFNFDKVRGNVLLMNGKIITPADVRAAEQELLRRPLP